MPINRLADFKAVRRPENAMTGLRLKPAGHALAAGVGVGMVGREVVNNAVTPRAQEMPGIQQAPRLMADMRQSPTSGATGELSMALADLQQAEGVSGI